MAGRTALVRGLVVARAQGALNEPARYRVFGSPTSAGNLATLIECERHELNDTTALLARTRALPAGDHAFFAADELTGHWRVRFFSHHGEIGLCGHALLALGHCLAERAGRMEAAITDGSPLAMDGCSVILQTRQGLHPLRWHDHRPWVGVPPRHCQGAEDDSLAGVLESAGLRVEHLALCAQRVWLAHCATAGEVAAFETRTFPWRALDLHAPGALILSAALGPYRYALRYFAPWHGKAEDSATGSAQCVLAPYWLRPGETGEARQLSPAGEAVIRVALDADQVWISGRVERA